MSLNKLVRDNGIAAGRSGKKSNSGFIIKVELTGSEIHMSSKKN